MWHSHRYTETESRVRNKVYKDVQFTKYGYDADIPEPHTTNCYWQSVDTHLSVPIALHLSLTYYRHDNLTWWWHTQHWHTKTIVLCCHHSLQQ